MAPTHTSRLALCALLALAGCSERTQYGASPLNRFIYPTAVALRHVAPGTSQPCPAGTVGRRSLCQTQLFVASSNADLRFDPATGGSVLALDVGAALAVDPTGSVPLRALEDLSPLDGQLGGVHVGSFTGELLVLDGQTCSTWSGVPQVLVASRSENALFRLALDGTGAPQAVDSKAADCSSGCSIPLHGALSPTGAAVEVVQARDPYGLALACGTLPDSSGAVAARALAFVGYLSVEDAEGGLSQLDLASTAAPASYPLVWKDLGVSPARSMVYDAVSTRLFIGATFGAYNFSPVRWLTLASPQAGYSSVNLDDVLRGSEPRSLAISTDRRRLYVAVRLFDTSISGFSTARPSTDIAGALVVLDLDPGIDGKPRLDPLGVVPLDRGATEVRVIPRATSTGSALPDLVAVVSQTDGRLTLYDDAIGAVAYEFGICPDDAGNPVTPGQFVPPYPCKPGRPALGRQPAGLAVEPLDPSADASGRALVRLYVASYDQSWVNVITLDPLHPDQGPTALVPVDAPSTPEPAWARLGPERLW